MWFVACIVMALILCLFLLGGLHKALFTHLAGTSFGVSLVLACGVFSLWNVIKTDSLVLSPKEVTMFDKIAVTKFVATIKKERGGAKTEKIISVNTGIFVNSIHFPDLNHVTLTGYIWQKYDAKKYPDYQPGFYLSQAPKATITESYRHKKGDMQTIGWDIKCTIFQEHSYALYPFDIKKITLFLEPKDKSQNIILIPDLESYRTIAPKSGPGIDDNLTIAGFSLIQSYFSYATHTPETNYGIRDQEKVADTVRLKFNAHLKRNALNSFVRFLLPILLVLFTLFSIIRVTESGLRQEAKRFSSFTSIAPYAAVFFPVVLVHQTFRNTFPISEILYLEYFFFFSYLTLAILMVHTVGLFTHKLSRAFQIKTTGLVKYLFWPFEFTLWFITTFFVFY